MSFLLREVLLEPQLALELSPRELHDLVSQGRSSRLLASLACTLNDAGVLQQFPDNVSRHFQSAVLTHEKQKRDLEYDVGKVRLGLDTAGEKLVLLKGAAYLMAKLPVGRGRLITDIDIIVPRARIGEAEQALKQSGWQSHEISAYDDAYYRKWSHEIPALTNPRRDTTLDVHHNILPPTAAPDINADLLFDELVQVREGVYTLSRRDMVIHSATHLFQEGEFHHGLRDLWDLDRMLRDFPAEDPAFWQGLVSRARELDLPVPLFHGLNYAQQVFATPIPKAVFEEAGNLSRSLRRPLMDFLFLRAFRPDHPRCRLPLTGLALNLLFLRSHYLRMPLHILIPHLARKAWMNRTDKAAETPAA